MAYIRVFKLFYQEYKELPKPLKVAVKWNFAACVLNILVLLLGIIRWWF